MIATFQKGQTADEQGSGADACRYVAFVAVGIGVVNADILWVCRERSASGTCEQTVFRRGVHQCVRVCAVSRLAPHDNKKLT